ncbi:hypothetical protein [Metabacillus sp. Hm71]|uniref:hypothetical protein n=1 Tax=Metabacillus sp. Hm71 TaxID=3450743 RepID=UPI003F43C5E4
MNYKCSVCGYKTKYLSEAFDHKDVCKAKPNMNFENSPIQEEINNNAVLKEVQDLLEAQTAKGLEKYGNTVDVDEYTLSDWIDHVLQEKMDELVYLVTIKHKIKKVIG